MVPRTAATRRARRNALAAAAARRRCVEVARGIPSNEVVASTSRELHVPVHRVQGRRHENSNEQCLRRAA